MFTGISDPFGRKQSQQKHHNWKITTRLGAPTSLPWPNLKHWDMASRPPASWFHWVTIRSFLG